MITGINHITFATNKLDESLDFYTNILGCELIAKWAQGAYLQAGNLWICLSMDINAQNEIPENYTHIAFSIDQKNFDNLKQRCIENKIQFWKENSSEGESIYLLDPDFHKLEIHYSNLQSRLQSMKISPYQDQEIIHDISTKL